MSEWPKVRFDQLASPDRWAFSIGPFGSKVTTGDYRDHGIPFIRGINLSQGIFTDSDFVFISDEKANEIESAIVRPGDLVFTRKGTVGQVSMIPRNPRHERYAISGSQVKARIDERRGVPEFYYYWFRSPAGRHSILEHAVTTGVPSLANSLASIRGLMVPNPPHAEQLAAAQVLGALDDKIAVNERIAATADSLASAIFADLMASCRAAEEVLLGDVASVNSMSVKPSKSGTIRYIDISSVGVGTYEWPEEIDWNNAPGRARRKASWGSTIWSTVRPNRRSHALVLDDDPDVVFSTGLAVLTPRSVGPAFLYEATRTPEFQNYLESVAEGSAYPAVRAERFNHAPIVLPDPIERENFEEAVMAMRRRAHQATVESRTLTALRDTLLPQLMSGRLRVKDTEKIAEDHA